MVAEQIGAISEGRKKYEKACEHRTPRFIRSYRGNTRVYSHRLQNSGGGSTTNNAPPPSGVTFSGPYGAHVFVPTGALSSAVTTSIIRESDNTPNFPPIDVTVVGAPYEITPHGTTFAVPVTVTIPFDATQVPAGSTPTLYNADPGGAFIEIPSTVVGNTLVAQVTDFSNFISAAGYPYLEYAYTFGDNVGVGTVYSFLVNATSGTLGPTAQAAYANGASINSTAIDRDGRYFYAETNILFAPIGSPPHTLKQYTLDSDGALVPVVLASGFDLPADWTSAPALFVGPTSTFA
jgi:hypothetical protein